MIFSREQVADTFRRRILEALDTAARETFNPSRNDAGASDEDLPRLFKALDAQIEALASRYDAILID